MNLIGIDKEAAFGRDLPKWPQMLVTGKPVTIEQAKDIIFATDTTLTSTWVIGGNDRDFSNWFKEITGYGKINSDNWRTKKPYSEMSAEEQKADRDLQNRVWRAGEAVRERADFLGTTYVSNSWADCSFIFGPHGWCHPDGNISYIDNVGKWPSVEEIFNDWTKIAKRWTFLDLHVTLMNAESCDAATSAAVVTFHVHDGIVEMFEGSIEPHKNKPLSRNIQTELAFGLPRGQGLPRHWITEFAEKIRPIVDEVVKEFNL
jgi:hypothetical protein